jgi:thioredoxin-related protein
VAQTASSAAQPRDPYQFFFDQTLNDYREELATAKTRQKKGILMFFEQDECPFCHYMKQNVLNQPGVQEYFRKNFINLAVDIEGDIEITDFEGKVMTQKDYSFRVHRVRATPVFIFFDLEGKRTVKFIGKTFGVDEFMLLGKYVAEGVYKDISFSRYKLNQKNPQKK